MPSGQAETQREARPAEIREGFLEEEPSTLCQGKGAGDKGDPQRASTSKGTKRANTAHQFPVWGPGPRLQPAAEMRAFGRGGGVTGEVFSFCGEWPLTWSWSP